jgi:hypothetical protein
MILFARDVRSTPHSESRKSSARFVTERRELRIAHSPTTVELLHYELAIKKQSQLRRSELSGKLNRRDERLPLRHIVRRGPDRSGDGGVRLCRRVISAVA